MRRLQIGGNRGIDGCPVLSVAFNGLKFKVNLLITLIRRIFTSMGHLSTILVKH